MLDQADDAILERVSTGRKMSVEQVDKIAGGRVCSGEAAKRIGLGDEIGGLQNALDYTATLLKAEDRFGLDVIILPKPLTTFEELMAFLSEQGAVYEGLKFQAMLGRVSKPFMDQMDVISQPNFTTYEPLEVQEGLRPLLSQGGRGGPGFRRVVRRGAYRASRTYPGTT